MWYAAHGLGRPHRFGQELLNIRLPGGPLPAVSHPEDLVAAWDLADFREGARKHAETLWQNSAVAAIFKDTIDGITAFASRALLVSVPYTGDLATSGQSKAPNHPPPFLPARDYGESRPFLAPTT